LIDCHLRNLADRRFFGCAAAGELQVNVGEADVLQKVVADAIQHDARLLLAGIDIDIESNVIVLGLGGETL
jgi:hypothetical protein